jgi:hypothetical protein
VRDVITGECLGSFSITPRGGVAQGRDVSGDHLG